MYRLELVDNNHIILYNIIIVRLGVKMKLECTGNVVTADFDDNHPMAYTQLPKMMSLLKEGCLIDRTTIFKLEGVTGRTEGVIEILNAELHFIPMVVAVKEERGFVVVLTRSAEYPIGSII